MLLSTILCVLALPLVAASDSTKLVRAVLGYKIAVNGQEHKVKSYDIDSRLRSLDHKQLGRLARVGVLKAYKMDNGDYRVEIGGGLKGGGAFGAWLGSALGYGGVHAITGGLCFIVSSPAYLLGGPAGAAVHAGVSAVAHSLVQPVAIAAGVAAGVSGAVLTGPV